MILLFIDLTFVSLCVLLGKLIVVCLCCVCFFYVNCYVPVLCVFLRKRKNHCEFHCVLLKNKLGIYVPFF